MSKFHLADWVSKTGDTLVRIYKKIENGAVNGYKKVENGAVNGYKKVEDKCVGAFLTRSGETVEEAKARLRGQNSST